MSLRIIATGGTFDKHYDPLTGNLIFLDSVLPEALDRARLTLPVSFEPVLALDSLFFLRARSVCKIQTSGYHLRVFFRINSHESAHHHNRRYLRQTL